MADERILRGEIRTPYTKSQKMNSPATIEYKLGFGNGDEESNMVK